MGLAGVKPGLGIVLPDQEPAEAGGFIRSQSRECAYGRADTPNGGIGPDELLATSVRWGHARTARATRSPPRIDFSGSSPSTGRRAG